ncbi:MAG: alpha-glucosidase [Clostridia bacterium]|nr:alpha-glucosidase [Clostridia bacterium]
MEQWHKESVVYQIYPKSYNDTNGDGIGDIRGIIEKLDYIRSLGVNCVWLSPCYPSPGDDNGYDISDYRGIAAEYGTLDEFKEMLDGMHKRGIRLLMDLVVNHTSDEHEWFVESRKSKDNPYRDYYIWRDPVDGKEPNGWTAAFGGSAWEYDEQTGQYYLHLFSKKQPDLNWENPKVRQEIADMINYWLDMGVDGFRCDVINNISKDFTRAYAGGNGPRLHEFLHELHERALAPHKALTVGETWGLTPDQALMLTSEKRGELTMTFQFEHLLLGRVGGDKFDPEPLDKKAFVDILVKWEYGLKNDSYPVLVMENHDQPRALSRFGDRYNYPYESATMLASMLYGMRGVPFIYQGQELGLHDPTFNSMSEYRDIETINAYNELKATGKYTEEELLAKMQYGSRDCGRTPIPWTSEKHGGFTTGEPWIKTQIDDGFTVEAQEKKERSVLNFYRKLFSIRNNDPCLKDGEFELLMNENDVSVYTRTSNDSVVYVISNFSSEERSLPDCVPTNAEVLLNNYNEIGVSLKPYQSFWLKK